MPLTPGERIGLIQESAALLDKQEWPVVDLVLEQHDMPISDENVSGTGTMSGYVIQMIRHASDENLLRLHGYLTKEAVPNPVAGGPGPGGKFRLFCSHLSAHRVFVGQVGAALARFGVEAFIAHDSIEPSKEWVVEIETALGGCDALVAFLHPGINTSNWCNQEIGWALGRKRPLLPLDFGVEPYGFMAKIQARTATGASAHDVARHVMTWLSKTPSLQGRLVHGLVDAFVNSPSWDFTRSVTPYLDQIQSVPDDDLARMEAAAGENVNVSDCVIPALGGRISGPEWVAAFVAARSTATVNL